MRHAAFAAVLAVLAFSGCYASTEPATEVKEESARLHARGTANNGPARSYFEYWKSDGTGFTRQTFEPNWPDGWPAGASGPFSETVENLFPATRYDFRVCGYDLRDGDQFGERLCAQTRSFMTLRPPGDRVKALFLIEGPHRPVRIQLDARSGPGGENPSGTLLVPIDNYTGFVTCLAVSGNRAAIGSVGQEASQNDPGPEFVLLTLGPPGSHLVGGSSGDGTPPPCADASLGDMTQGGPSEVGIYDAP
jgi:hypothetical protein